MGIRQSIRDGITRTLLSDHVRAMEETIHVMEQAYRRGPAMMDERALVDALSEADSYLIDYVLRQRGYQLLSQSVIEFTEEDRLRAVEEARHMYRSDVQVARAVNLWTDFGFGQSVEIVPHNEALGAVFDEFWTARRNAPLLSQRRIHMLSNDVINDGEVFLVVFGSNVDGKSTVRRMDTKAITRIVYEEDDPDIPLYYVRYKAGTQEVWYPDWRATPDQLARVEIPTNARLITDEVPEVTIGGKLAPVTSVKVLHVAYDELNGRGWPTLSRVYTWNRVLRNFLGDRAAVAKRVAMYVDRIQHKGGSRAQDAIEAKFQSALNRNTFLDTNPPAPAGSTAVHNQAVDWYRQPLTTGGGDAMSDGQMFAGQISVGVNMPLHWLGWPQALSNRATAREMARPTLEALERYQGFWSSIFRDLVEIVGMNAGEFDDYGADITLQTPIDTDVEDLARGMEAITDATQSSAIDPELAIVANEKLAGRMLQVLGVPGAFDDIEQEEGEPTPEQTILMAIAENVRAGLITEKEAEDYLSTEPWLAAKIGESET